MKKLRNILFFLGIIMISLGIGLVFMNLTVSKQTIEKNYILLMRQFLYYMIVLAILTGMSSLFQKNLRMSLYLET